MKEQLPTPDFDASQYARPNDNWVCGHAADGKPCRIGPSPNGRCRATFECAPLLDLKNGETKGRHKCTRPKQHGGPCELGPLPDGTCSRAIPKCAPTRSMKAKRRIFTLTIVSLTLGALLVVFCGPLRFRFISPAPLSAPHSSAAFAKKIAGLDTPYGCAACHAAAAKENPAGWMQAAFRAEPSPLQWHAALSTAPPHATALDQNCARCHTARNFHQPNVVWDYSCSACHQEHKGGGPIAPPDNSHCVTCHGSAAIMEASFQKGKTLTLEIFNYRPAHNRVLFRVPRPERGYTQVLQSFADHPEFQISAEKLKETNTLRFNHARHFADDIPLVGGKKLACADCHKPDADGVYHQKISFEANCKTCHALQFDARNPELTLPHGDAAAVRAFLRSLPTQYADFGARGRSITAKHELENFVARQLDQLREQYPSGDDLERAVFFSTEHTAPAPRVGDLPEQGRARFAGCAYCHEVKAADGAPIVTKPILPDRWLIRSSFHHAKHAHVSCVTCHDVVRSQSTADILLPNQATCATCHGPQGGVAHSCATCHSYHTVTAK